MRKLHKKTSQGNYIHDFVALMSPSGSLRKYLAGANFVLPYWLRSTPIVEYSAGAR
jgi:hypothetical protein